MQADAFQQLIDFILFKVFIAEHVLTIFYVFCTLLIPVVAWYFLFWVIRRYAIVLQFYKDTRYSFLYSILMWIIRKIKFFSKKIDEKITWQTLSTQQKLKFLGLYVAMVFMAEVFLRLVFEYLIAFMQMHDYLKPPGI